jgi:hypothetical protein
MSVAVMEIERSGRDSAGRFAPGNTIAPQQPKVAREVKAMLKEGVNKAIWLLLDTLDNPEAPLRLRIDCANSILDRGLGKPSQSIAIDSEREFQVVFQIPRPGDPLAAVTPIDQQLSDSTSNNNQTIIDIDHIDLPADSSTNASK